MRAFSKKEFDADDKIKKENGLTRMPYSKLTLEEWLSVLFDTFWVYGDAWYKNLKEGYTACNILSPASTPLGCA